MLAIAGLIFLMVFIALPALQRNQRDTQRRQDYAQLASQIQGYMTNNGNKLPDVTSTTPGTTSEKLDPKKFINADGTNPQGDEYSIVVADYSDSLSAPQGPTTVNNTTSDIVYVVRKAKTCSGGVPTEKGADRNFAIYGYLEGGSTYCQAY